MKFQRLFKICSYGLLLTGFLALAFTGAVELTGILLYTLVLMSSWWWEDRRSLLPVRVQNVLILAYLGFYLVDLLYFSRPVLATVHLAFFVSAIKLFSKKSPRDYLFLYLFAFAQLLIAATFPLNILFALHVFLFVLFGIGCLMLHEIFSAKWRMGENPSGEGPSWRAAPFAAGTLLITVAICLLSIPFFLILPRLPASFVHNLPHAGALSGLMDHINLADIGPIKLNPAVVMRVKVNRSPTEIPAGLKWRGISLSYFDGSRWSRGVEWFGMRANASGGYRVGTESYRSAQLLKQIFVVEPGSPGILFYAPRLISVSNEVQDLAADPDGNFFFRRPHAGGRKYTLFSALLPGEPRVVQPHPSPIPPVVAGRYLALPGIDTRIKELARQVTAGDKEVLEKAKSIERFLKVNYRYSLDLSMPRGVDPLAYFLFEAKAGHCEFFASAEAVMLRTLEIPARIVNGFRGGEFNDWGDDFIVRQSDAHSWVEVYVPGIGWVESDPTPAGPGRQIQPWLAAVGHLFDAIDLYWTTEVLAYDFWKQVFFFRSVRERLAAVSRQAEEWAMKLRQAWKLGAAAFDSARGGIGGNWILWACGIAAAGWLAFRSRLALLAAAARLTPRSRSPKVEALLVSRCYLRFLQKLERRGFKRRQGETAQELVARIDVESLRAPAAVFARLYYRQRYGSVPGGGVQSLIAALERVL